MARNEPQVNLRMPEALKADLEAAAVKNKRSLTAEIIARLEASLGPEPATAAIATLLQAQEERLKSWLQESLNKKP